MKAAARAQLKIRLDPELDAAVRRYCAAHNLTQTALTQAALKEYLGNTSPMASLMKRLDHMSLEIEHQRRALHLLAEAFGTYVRLWLGHTPEIHPQNIEEERRKANARYRRFAEHVAQRLTGGDSFFMQFAPSPVASSAELDAARHQLEGRHAT